jgi:hypothetical protein
MEVAQYIISNTVIARPAPLAEAIASPASGGDRNDGTTN